MRRKTRWMALFMAAAMMMTGCGSSGSTESTDASADTASAVESVSTDTASAGGKVVTMARDLDSSNLDPVMTADNCDIWILNMIVEGLVGTSDDGKEIIPAVADTWTVSDDGLEYVFHIRDGIKFSNGEDVTVKDCIYSLTRAKDTDGPWIGMLDMIASMEDAGDNQLKITLTEASPSFLSVLAMFSSGIMPEAYCEEVGEEGISSAPVGTGPYVLSEWDKGEKMIFTKNDYYWEEGCPKVDEIDMTVVADDNTRIMQLESGQIDIATQIPYSRIDELKAVSGLNVSL
ncbi:MAG: ABC transporter substrate-binding protein, partial [Lachnospiraceae bacterium]|nr:ABC transporter substrate-binding protein [Lachnospiraceae bacterium]